MLEPNSDIWATRIQNISVLLTASAQGRDEVYYLATVCQVGLSPPLVSISPNPEYPICDLILESGYFGLGFLAEDQDAVVKQCVSLDRRSGNKLDSLGLECERTRHDTPLPLNCLQAIEFSVEQRLMTGDHLCVIGLPIDRRIRSLRIGERPHRFEGKTPYWKQWARTALYRTRLYDALTPVRQLVTTRLGIEEGTRIQITADSPGAVDVQRPTKAHDS